MPESKTKIVLDADVIIHFIKGDCLTALFDIFPGYKYIVLDVVYYELDINGKKMIDNFERILKKVEKIKFNAIGASLKEYFLLRSKMGKGESACMIYCKDHKDVLGSSNLKDISEFCTKHGITILTTLDFLYYACIKDVMTYTECNETIRKIKERGSKLPDIKDIRTYKCNTLIM